MRDAVTRIGVQPLAQFGAVTFIDEAGATYVVFRGTDGTAVGWAEDAQFGLDFPTIAQLWAARYLRYAAGRAPGPSPSSAIPRAGTWHCMRPPRPACRRLIMCILSIRSASQNP